MDFSSDVVDGLEVCRELRQRVLQLPVLMLTAKSEVVD